MSTVLVPATIFRAEHPHPPGMARRPHAHVRTSSPTDDHDNAALALQAGKAVAALLPGMLLIAQPEALISRLDALSVSPLVFYLPLPDQPPRLIGMTGSQPVARAIFNSPSAVATS